MEKPEKLKKVTIQINHQPESSGWDCGSVLYDSFELKSFKRQLDSAINSRSMSLPHLPDRRIPSALDHPAPTQKMASHNKKPSKISRSINKLVRSIFGSSKIGSSRVGSFFRVHEQPRDGIYVLYDKSGALTTIPEAPEIDHLASLSPEINSLVRKTASDRFTAPTNIGI